MHCYFDKLHQFLHCVYVNINGRHNEGTFQPFSGRLISSPRLAVNNFRLYMAQAHITLEANSLIDYILSGY